MHHSTNQLGRVLRTACIALRVVAPVAQTHMEVEHRPFFKRIHKEWEAVFLQQTNLRSTFRVLIRPLTDFK